MNTDETIAAQLERIEAKLDLVLEKLKWAPQDMAESGTKPSLASRSRNEAKSTPYETRQKPGGL